VYETLDFDGDRVTVLRQLVAGDPRFEKSGKRGDGKGEKTQTATIVLRGGTANNLNDLESAIDDGMNLIRSLLQDRRLVPGAGAMELELTRRVEVYGGKMKGQQRDVVKRFAMALEVIPRTLAENAAVGEREANKVVNPFKGEDEATEPSDGYIKVKPPSDGMILADSNSLPYPILDSLAVKRCAIKQAMGAAVLVLTIDSDIMRKQAGQGNWSIKMPLTIIFNLNFNDSETSSNFFLLDIFIIIFSVPLIMIPTCILMLYIDAPRTIAAFNDFFKASPFLDSILFVTLLIMIILYCLFRLKSSK